MKIRVAYLSINYVPMFPVVEINVVYCPPDVWMYFNVQTVTSWKWKLTQSKHAQFPKFLSIDNKRDNNKANNYANCLPVGEFCLVDVSNIILKLDHSLNHTVLNFNSCFANQPNWPIGSISVKLWWIGCQLWWCLLVGRNLTQYPRHSPSD